MASPLAVSDPTDLVTVTAQRGALAIAIDSLGTLVSLARLSDQNNHAAALEIIHVHLTEVTKGVI